MSASSVSLGVLDIPGSELNCAVGSALRVSMALWAKFILEMCIRRELKGHDHAVVVIIIHLLVQIGYAEIRECI